MTVRYAFCSGCQCIEPVDEHWLALWIDSDGELIITAPEHGCDLDYERRDTVFACGQGSALVLTERYLHHRSFDHIHESEDMTRLTHYSASFAEALY